MLTSRTPPPEMPSEPPAAVTNTRSGKQTTSDYTAEWLARLNVKMRAGESEDGEEVFIDLAGVLRDFRGLGIRETVGAMLRVEEVHALALEAERASVSVPSWDVNFAIREWVIPAPGGLFPVIDHTDVHQCWIYLMELAEKDRSRRLERPNLDTGIRARLNTAIFKNQPIPDSFLAVVGDLQARIRHLFHGLALGLLTAEAVNPGTKVREAIEARIWSRANIALDIKTGDLINQRTGDVEWYDVCISSPVATPSLPSFVQNRSDSGRKENTFYLRALDSLLVEGFDRDNFEEKFLSGSDLAKMMEDHFHKLGEEPPGPRSIERWIEKRLPKLWKRITGTR